MRLSLWILNSSLFAIFLVTFAVNIALQQKPPVLRINPIATELGEKKAPIAVNLDKIYRQDLFDTFSPEEKIIAQQNFVSPVPQTKPPVFVPPPPAEKQEFVDPLNISIKGIISTSPEEKSVAMIADEAGKEKVYHLSDKIHDGQLIKIEKNKIIILRANGQQEIYALRKDELMPPGEKPANKWQYVAKKIDDQNYEIDPSEFTKQIQTMGNLVEDLNLSTAYKNSEAIGIKVGEMQPGDIGSVIGLNKNDILLSINEIDTINPKNRIKIYDTIMQMENGDEIKLVLQKNNIQRNITYKLTEIERPKKQFFLESAKEGEQNQTPEFKTSAEQERENRIRKFEKQHQTQPNQGVVSDIRKRLLENMKRRAVDRRVRR